MVKMINGLLGTEMWVAEERVEEYKAAGHKLAAADTKPVNTAPKGKTKSAKKTK